MMAGKVTPKGEQEIMQLGHAYSSSNWFVMAGSEEEFVSQWTALAEWVSNNMPGAKSAVSVRPAWLEYDTEQRITARLDHRTKIQTRRCLNWLAATRRR
jgi:hypothetical protein